MTDIVTKVQNVNSTFRVQIPITLEHLLPSYDDDNNEYNYENNNNNNGGDEYGRLNINSISSLIPILRYTGSLTTPPCTEGITWLLMGKPKLIGQREVCLFIFFKN